MESEPEAESEMESELEVENRVSPDMHEVCNLTPPTALEDAIVGSMGPALELAPGLHELTHGDGKVAEDGFYYMGGWNDDPMLLPAGTSGTDDPSDAETCGHVSAGSDYNFYQGHLGLILKGRTRLVNYNFYQGHSGPILKGRTRLVNYNFYQGHLGLILKGRTRTISIKATRFAIISRPTQFASEPFEEDTGVDLQ
ncbi:hypothetical protein JB92DRAFT_3129297 [Gautieria morchelliformis]|nr:hypothetical protein JB92DRAFT_3129297 [Gautieria morchelliformis]